MLDLMHLVVKFIQEDKQARIDQMKQKKNKMTEEMIEEVQLDIERLDKILNYVHEISGVCLRTMPQAVSETVLVKLVPLFAKGLDDVPSREDYELISSLCFFCDCVENGTENLVNPILQQLSGKFIEVMARLTGSIGEGELNTDLLQTVVFGMGCLAQKMP